MTRRKYEVEITFLGDWGVATGTGRLGGVDSVIERDSAGIPVVRATTLTGVVREQAKTAAQALDEGTESGPWSKFADALFGTPEQPRLVSFSDAFSEAEVPVDTVVSVSLEEDTQTAKDDQLRFIERAGKATLKSTVTLLEIGQGGKPITWTEHQVDGALALLSLACSLVEGIGSNRSVGDGRCRIELARPEGRSKDWPWSELSSLENAPEPPTPGIWAPPVVTARHATPTFVLPLHLHLDTPLISYETPTSNENRTLDFLRGTVLLPWVHWQLRRHSPDSDLVRDAVIAGDLMVSDALVNLPGSTGVFPVPLVLSRPKSSDTNGTTYPALNRLRQNTDEVHVPLREGYLFEKADGSWAYGTPPRNGRQSTGHNSQLRKAADGQLFLIQALTEGLDLEAHLLVSDRLMETVPDMDQLLSTVAMLGAKSRTGRLGTVTCKADKPSPLKPPTLSWDADGAITLWFASDLLLRTPSLSSAAGLPELLAELARRGAKVRTVPDLFDATPNHKRSTYAAGLRFRRVDSWTSAGVPRSTRMAVKAGSVLRLAPAVETERDTVLKALEEIAVTGLGELRAQGYGRVLIGHPLLSQDSIELHRLERKDFLPDFEKEGRL